MLLIYSDEMSKMINWLILLIIRGNFTVIVAINEMGMHNDFSIDECPEKKTMKTISQKLTELQLDERHFHEKVENIQFLNF